MVSQYDTYTKELGRSKYDVIKDRAVERDLLLRYCRTHDQKVFETLIHANMRFVMFVMKEFTIPPSLNIMDVIQEGNRGLIVGIKRFNPMKYPDNKLFSYAVWWIRLFIRRALSTHKAYDSRRVQLMDDEQLESSTRMSHDDSDVQIFFQQASDTVSEKSAVADINDFLLSVLDRREAAIIRLYYGLGEHNHHLHTLESIGQQLHIKFVRVRQLRDRAIEKLRVALDGESLDTYL